METTNENVIVKNVTSEYVEAKKKRNKKELIFNLIKGFVLLIVALLPVASIGDYNFENSYLFVFNYLQNLINKETTSRTYLLYFVIFSIAIIMFGVVNIWNVISRLKKKEDSSNEQFFINEKDENFVVSFKFIVLQILESCVFLCIAYVLITINNSKLKVYGLTSYSNLIIIVYFALLIFENISCAYTTLKYDEKCANTEEDIFMRAEKKKRRPKFDNSKREKGFKFDNFMSYFIILLIIVFICACICTICCFSYYHVMYNGYTYMGRESVAGWVLSPEDKDLLRFDVVSLSNNENGRIVKVSGYGCKTITLVNSSGGYEDNTKSFVFYGDSYDFANAKIEELEKEILELWPEDNSEEAFEKYLKQIEDMDNAIKLLKEKNVYPYEFVDFIDGYMVDLQYNASGKDEIKWGVKQESIKSLIFQERISLTDRYCKNKKSMDRFAVGTDFNNELIVARVQYNDGSVRISKIKPTNVEELNNAKAGKHIIKWEDSWGKYETQITLYDN